MVYLFACSRRTGRQFVERSGSVEGSAASAVRITTRFPTSIELWANISMVMITAGAGNVARPQIYWDVVAYSSIRKIQVWGQTKATIRLGHFGGH